MILLLAVYIFVLSLLFALLEIEIEGKFGWAEKLPTWYKKSGFSRIFSFFNSKKPLTGYHLFLLLFIFLIVHMSFIMGLTWSLAKELQLLALYVIFLTLEDFLWFVFNPYYGLKNFKKNKIWWHADCKWILGLFPNVYINAVIMAGLLYYSYSYLMRDIQLFYQYFVFLGFILVLLILSIILLSSLYKKWYFSMRKKDERKNCKIFH